MESILEEDENQAKDNNMMPGLGRLKTYDVTATISAKHQTSLRVGKDFQGSTSNGSTTLSQNVHPKAGDNELSTAQTSGGFSNTRRSPRELSFESNNVRAAAAVAGGDKQLRMRP